MAAGAGAARTILLGWGFVLGVDRVSTNGSRVLRLGTMLAARQAGEDAGGGPAAKPLVRCWGWSCGSAARCPPVLCESLGKPSRSQGRDGQW